MGHYLSSPNREKITEEGDFKNMKYVASGMQGWRVTMEDSHLAKFNIAPDTHIFGVFDGHGGHEVAKYVTNHFVDELLANASYKSGNYSKALVDTFLRLDDMLRTPEGKKELSAIQLGQGKSGGFGSGEGESFAGCTAVVSLMVKDKLYVANAGDSRCMVASKGDVVPLTEDHKPDNKPEKDRIEKAGGEVYEGRINGRLNLSRAIGDLEFKDNTQLQAHEQLVIALPEVKVWNLSADDEYIVLGCDGIWECLPAKQIYEFFHTKVKNGKSLKLAVEELLDYMVATDTQTGLGLDNMTCVVVALK